MRLFQFCMLFHVYMDLVPEIKSSLIFNQFVNSQQK